MKRDKKEYGRWLFSSRFLKIFLLVVICIFVDIISSSVFRSDCAAINGMRSSVMYYLAERSGFMEVLCLGITCFAGGNLYMQDIQSNGVYMRIHRMGLERYVRVRMFQNVAASLLLGIFGILFACLLVASIFSCPFFPEAKECAGYFKSSFLLAAGHKWLYMLYRCVQQGFYFLFYNAIGMIMTAFIPKVQIMVVCPFVCWGINEWILANLPFYPDIIKPSFWFEANAGMIEIFQIPDLLCLLVLALFMATVVASAYMIFSYRLSHGGVFREDTGVTGSYKR